MNDNLHLELVAKMPWLMARKGSWWVISGTQHDGAFSDCVAQALPAHVTGDHAGNELPLFEIHMIGVDDFVVPADRIMKGRELVMVWKDQPATAIHEQEQFDLDCSIERLGQ